jgi:ketosteroid isomerase-like protein
MKRCPTCQRTYADDSLRFCLQDGTALLSVSDAPASLDPSATLVLPESATARHEPPPTEMLPSQTGRTLPMPKAAATAPHQPPRATMRAAQEALIVPSPKSQNSALVIGLAVTVAILLLALGSVGAWMLLRDDKGGETKEERASDNRNNTVEPTANSNGRASSNAPVSPSMKPTPTSSPTTTTTAPPADTAAAIREQVTATLNGWAAASMEHDINKHMSYYADTLDVYYSSSDVSAARVRSDRERAYAVYSKIDIQLSKISVTVDPSGERATATFDKTWNFDGSKYSSGSVQQRVWLTKMGGRWRITGEKDLKVYYVDK